ncbi:hypothetical protein V8D89_005717 [Ganoderma adspersum]
MQTNFSSSLARLDGDATGGAPNTNPSAVPSAVVFATPDAATVEGSGPLKRTIAGLDDPSLQPAPSAVKKTAPRAVIPPAQIVNMLTNTPPTPDAVAPVNSTHDTVLRELRVGAMLAQSRAERGKLALGMCRLRTMHQAATGEELFSQERFDSYMGVVNQCISPLMTGDILAEVLPGYNPAATQEDVGDLSPASSTSISEDEGEDEDEDEMDEDEDGN